MLLDLRLPDTTDEFTGLLMEVTEHGLRDLRLTRGLTQRQLAEKVGTSRGNIASIECGRRSEANLILATAVKLCDALHVSNPRKLLERTWSSRIPNQRRRRNPRSRKSCWRIWTYRTCLLTHSAMRIPTTWLMIWMTVGGRRLMCCLRFHVMLNKYF